MKKDIVFRLRPLGPSLRASTSPPQLLLARRETRRKLKDLHSVSVCVIYTHAGRTRFAFFCTQARMPMCVTRASICYVLYI